MTESNESTHEEVSASGAVINVRDVEDVIASTEFGEEEPLPVGANDPDAPKPLDAPAGMPAAPDEVDAQIAAFVSAIHNDATDTYIEGMGFPAQAVRPDQATIADAFRERIYDAVKPRTPKEALLVQVQRMRAEEREAALAWSKAVREQQEARDMYETYRANRLAAMDALAALGLTDDVDFVRLEESYPQAKVEAVIPDGAIL